MLTYRSQYAALSKTPHALADGLMLVFQHPDKLKPTLFRYQSQFPTKAREQPALGSKRQRNGAWKKAWGVLGEKECGIGGA